MGNGPDPGFQATPEAGSNAMNNHTLNFGAAELQGEPGTGWWSLGGQGSVSFAASKRGVLTRGWKLDSETLHWPRSRNSHYPSG